MSQDRRRNGIQVVGGSNPPCPTRPLIFATTRSRGPSSSLKALNKAFKPTIGVRMNAFLHPNDRRSLRGLGHRALAILSLCRWLPLLILIAASCSTPPAATTTTTRAWAWTVLVPPTTPDENATVDTILYAGGTARTMTPDVTVRGLTGGLAEVRLTTVTDRQLVKVWRAADVPADGHLTDVPTVQGSAVRLAISTPTGVRWPTVVVNSITTVDAPTGPEEGALVVSPGDTVDTVFDSQLRAVFLKVAPLGHDAIDLVGFGAGDLIVADPATTDFVLDPSIAWSVMALTRDGSPPAEPSGMTRVISQTISSAQALRLTWVPPNAAAVAAAAQLGHARLVVRSVMDGKLAFPARDRNAFFGRWFGVDHDGATQPGRNCGAHNLGCKTDEQLDKLECSDWNGRRAIVTNSITHVRAPALGPPLCYDGHEGTDFGLRGSVIGQAIGVDVTAAQAGVVVFADDAHRDDCFFDPFAGGIQCADVEYKRPFWEELKPGAETPPNLVGIREDDGLVAWYFHLRQGSVSVVVGQSVKCGQKLAQVGSAGHSAGPHLHFELRALRGVTVVPSFRYDDLHNMSDWIDPFPDKWVTWHEGEPPDNTCPEI